MMILFLCVSYYIAYICRWWSSVSAAAGIAVAAAVAVAGTVCTRRRYKKGKKNK
jgi:hypothetical protein